MSLACRAAAHDLKDFFKVTKKGLLVFAILMAFTQLPLVSLFGGFLLIMPIYPIVYTVQQGLMMNPSQIGAEGYVLAYYGTSVPIYAAYFYLRSCVVVFIFGNIGGPRDRLEVAMVTGIVLAYAVPFGYSIISNLSYQ